MYRKCFLKAQCPLKKEEIESLCSDVPNDDIDEDMCACGFDEDNAFPRNPLFGQSYVPWQVMQDTFTPEVGLCKGTIYPELVSPYVPCQSMEENIYLAQRNKIGEGCNKCQMN